MLDHTGAGRGRHRRCRLRRHAVAPDAARPRLSAAYQAVRRFPCLHPRRIAHAGRLFDAGGLARPRARHALAAATPRADEDVAAGMNLPVELTCVNVERSGQRVVQDVDLTVAHGSWFGLIGANGSGKTSLLRALAGRLPFAGGSCRIGGEELVGDRAARALRFGFSPPADTLPDALRGRDVLELVGGSIDDVRSRLGKLHEGLGLAPLLDRWIGDCSAGMRQRIAIAAAFAGGHSLVILDEPFNWLDPVAIFDLREVLRDMVDAGLTLITALHDLGTLASACDAGLMLADGKVALALDEGMLRIAAQNPQAFERQTIDRLRSGSTTSGA